MMGYGRGSKKLGIPTANLPHFDKQFNEGHYPTGVYFGWASVRGEMFTAVVNIGKSPTFVGQVSCTVTSLVLKSQRFLLFFQENAINIAEVHLLDYNMGDFYGSPLRVGLLMYMRPETRFPSFDALIKQINADISDARQYDKLARSSDVSSDEFAAKLHSARAKIQKYLLDSNQEANAESAKASTEKVLWAEIDYDA